MTTAHERIHSSKSNEWYTPPRYIHAAREVMGSIDLDPASCEEANKIVCAWRYYNQAEDGLRRQWHGHVWLNPPYGKDVRNRSNQEIWSDNLLQEYCSGRVSQAVLLVNAVPDRKWFQPLWGFPVCFTDHRIKFISLDGTPKHQPTHGNAFVYFGPRRRQFHKVFLQFGRVVMP